MNEIIDIPQFDSDINLQDDPQYHQQQQLSTKTNYLHEMLLTLEPTVIDIVHETSIQLGRIEETLKVGFLG